MNDKGIKVSYTFVYSKDNTTRPTVKQHHRTTRLSESTMYGRQYSQQI